MRGKYGHEKKSAQAGSNKPPIKGRNEQPKNTTTPPAQPPKPPPPPGGESTSSDEPNEKREQLRTAVQVSGLVVLVVYTIFTALMWCANKKAADAAKSAADTAKETLHVTERAYLSITAPTNDSQNTLTFQLVNTGHLHADDVKVTVYRLAERPPESVFDIGKTELNIPSMQSGLPTLFPVVFDNLPPETDIHRAELVVVGSAEYGTGFNDEPRQTFPFCLRTEWELKLGKAAIVPCDVNMYLTLVKNLISEGEKGKH